MVPDARGHTSFPAVNAIAQTNKVTKCTLVHRSGWLEEAIHGDYVLRGVH